MHEKLEYLLAQKTERQEEIRQNKLPLQLLSLLPQILFNVNFSIRIFAINIFKNFNRCIEFLVNFLCSQLLLLSLARKNTSQNI